MGELSLHSRLARREVKEMPCALVVILCSIDCFDFISSRLAIVGDNELVRRILVHGHLHHFLDSVRVVRGSEVQTDIGWGWTRVIFIQGAV